MQISFVPCLTIISKIAILDIGNDTLAEKAVTLSRVDIDTFADDRTDDVVLLPGWTAVAISAVRYGKECIVQGYLSKSSNVTHGDPMIRIPADMLPMESMIGAVYGVGHGAATDKTCRVNINTTTEPGKAYIEARNPSSGMVNVVFSLAWLSES